MRILHIGHNDGSHIHHTVKLLRDKGIYAVGMCFYHSAIVNYEGLYVYKKRQFISYYLRFLYELLRCDLVHLWSTQIFGIVFLIKLLGKRFVIEWTGCDIRNPELMNEGYKVSYYGESKEKSYKNQKPFKNVTNIISSAVLGKHLINSFTYIPHRIYYEDYTPSYHFHEPLRITHAPSDRQAKGTDAVLVAGHLTGLDIRIIENTDNDECIRLISESDLFLDQFVWGEHGMASMEAMCVGKPVMCWLNHNEPTGIMNVKPEDLVKKLRYYIKNSDQLIKLGMLSRAFVELSVDKAISDLVQIYEIELGLNWFENNYNLNPLV